MSDILERLREASRGGDVFVSPGQAADEIEKLQKRIAELEAARNDALAKTTEAEQERDEFFNRLGRITEYLELPEDATAQRIIETIRERVENERESCASVEVRFTVPGGAETWTPLESWEEAIVVFDEAFRAAIRAMKDHEP